MSDLPYMPLYVSKYVGDTAHLTTLESGAYLALIFTYWMRQKALPDDAVKLARIAKLSTDEWCSMAETIAELFQVSDGLWRHKRIESELVKAKEKLEQASSAGRASAESRRDKRSTSVERPMDARSTPVERPMDARSTEVERGFNHKVRLGKDREEVIPSPPAERERDATGERALEVECRKLAINLPAMADANFVPVLKLLDEGILPEDVLVAMRDIGQKNHPLRNWHGVGSWARKAAKDRLEMAMPSANYARAGPTNGQKTPCSHSERRANGTPKSPSDFIKEFQRQRADDAPESPNQKLLS
jgi:uncharacterized protein YdaU (DUF1376 family)